MLKIRFHGLPPAFDLVAQSLAFLGRPLVRMRVLSCERVRRTGEWVRRYALVFHAGSRPAQQLARVTDRSRKFHAQWIVHLG